jgi:hypothetical protein
MMVKLLFYGYTVGIPSSRRIEKKTYEDIAFRVLATDQHPDHDTLCDFRKTHYEVLRTFFVQVLEVCQEAGLVKLGHVSFDGTKVKANASKHKAMSYARMLKKEAELEREVDTAKGGAATRFPKSCASRRSGCGRFARPRNASRSAPARRPLRRAD